MLRDLEVTCAACGTAGRHAVAESIDAGTQPDLRRQILDDTFQRFPCERCGERMLVESPMLLIHFERHHWLELFPAPWERAWRALEQDTIRRFEQTAILHAPPMVRDHAGEFVVRTVFGLHALREKLVVLDAGLDDRALEALKLDLLRTEPDLVGDPAVRLRLRTATAELLVLSVHGGARAIGELTAARARLDLAASEPWQRTREAVSGGPYVDVGRLLVDRQA